MYSPAAYLSLCTPYLYIYIGIYIEFIKVIYICSVPKLSIMCGKDLYIYIFMYIYIVVEFHYL